MNKLQAKSKIKNYLKRNFIQFHEDVWERITMVYKGFKNSPDSIIESCIYFFSDCMECRVYYDATGAKFCKESDRQSELMRLLNFINARVWPQSTDFNGNTLYRPSHLYTPRIYMTEDGCNDITMTTVVPYEFYEIATLETEDFFTACLPELMDSLSPAIFLLLLGRINPEDAIGLVKINVLNEEDNNAR